MKDIAPFTSPIIGAIALIAAAIIVYRQTRKGSVDMTRVEFAKLLESQATKFSELQEERLKLASEEAMQLARELAEARNLLNAKQREKHDLANEWHVKYSVAELRAMDLELYVARLQKSIALLKARLVNAGIEIPELPSDANGHGPDAATGRSTIIKD